MSFADEMKAFQKLALTEMSDGMNLAGSDFFQEAVAKSPTKPEANYAQGYLKNNWYTSVGETASSDVGSAPDTNGYASLSRISNTFKSNPFYGKDNLVSLSNNTEQAYFADVLGWPSGLGTNGWVWSGRVGPYNMTAHSVNYLLARYG